MAYIDFVNEVFTAHKMKFSNKDFFSKCDQIRSFLKIWSHLLKKSLMENFIFCSVFNLFKANDPFKFTAVCYSVAKAAIHSLEETFP